MELKQGYKLTEVGFTPEDWEVVEFGGICSPLKDKFNPIRSKNRPCIELEDLSQETGRLLSLSDSVKKVSMKTIFKVGDVLFGKLRPYLRKFYFADFDGVCSTEIWALSPKPEIHSKFVFYQVQSKRIIDSANIAIGTKMPRAEWKTVAETKITIPPLLEQIAIANALSDMDALISQTEKLIEKKKAIKQGAMQELLKPKEGWVTKKLGDIGVISGAGVDKKINANEISVRMLNYMDVYKRDFIYSNELNHWVTAPANKLANCSVKQGDVFFTPSSETRTDIGLAAVAMEDIIAAVYSYHVMRFRLLFDWDLKFKVYIFQTKNFLDQTEKMCEGGGKRYVLTMPKFRALSITYPESTIEQQEISGKLWDMDQELKLLSIKLTKLKQQKQGMMQALLTGKIRLI